MDTKFPLSSRFDSLAQRVLLSCFYHAASSVSFVSFPFAAYMVGTIMGGEYLLSIFIWVLKTVP